MNKIYNFWESTFGLIIKTMSSVWEVVSSKFRYKFLVNIRNNGMVWPSTLFKIIEWLDHKFTDNAYLHILNIC